MSDATEVNTQLNRAPTISNPTVSRVSNSTSELTITATATDQDENDVLTYKLLRGTSANDANPTELALAPENVEGRTVTFKDMGLSMDTYYWYKIKVSDGIDNDTSENYGSERTWCLGSPCAGGGINRPDCPDCDEGKKPCTNSDCVDGKIKCTTCRGSGKVGYVKGDECSKCSGWGFLHNCQSTNWHLTNNINIRDYCPRCGAYAYFPNSVYYCDGCGNGLVEGGMCYTCGVRQWSTYQSAYKCFECDGVGCFEGTDDCSNCINGYNDCTTCKGKRHVRL